MWEIRSIVGVLVAAACLPCPLAEAQETITCTTCHSDEADELGDSVHAGLGCWDCHGGQESYVLPENEAAFDHGESFTGKPPRARIPYLCGECHANVERMNPYGLRTDQLARYWTSGHGRTLAKTGDERVAVCVDCHGSHEVLSGDDPGARTHPLNVPDTCAACHIDAELMGAFDLSVEIFEEYRQSVHGRLLFEQGDTGAPTCATCHGNHSAVPPGFATVGAVCGQCHVNVASDFAASVHGDQEEFKGCVQCHGGGEGSHFHRIERITRPAGVLVRRYARLLKSDPSPSPERIARAIHPAPKRIMMEALPTCLECHDDLDEDESLPKLFTLLDEIASAERRYVKTARRLDEVGKGVLLVDNQRFKFEEAKTVLIGLAPLQHTLDASRVADEVATLNAICEEVEAELEELERGLRWRYRALAPIWIFVALFATALYVKYKRLKAAFVVTGPSKSMDR